MSNDKLRKVMIGFTLSFGLVFIIYMYVHNEDLKKTGPRTDFSGPPAEYKTEYYESGQKKSQGPVRDGYIKEGEWIYYREDGSIEGKEMYKNGKLVRNE